MLIGLGTTIGSYFHVLIEWLVVCGQIAYASLSHNLSNVSPFVLLQANTDTTKLKLASEGGRGSMSLRKLLWEIPPILYFLPCNLMISTKTTYLICRFAGG